MQSSSNPRDILDLLSPGMRVFVHAGASLPRDFLDALSAEPERARGVEFVGAFIPGVNTFDFAALAPEARMVTTFGGGFHRKSPARERIHVLPKGYMSFVRYLADQTFDLAILHLAPPRADGRLSYGINQDFVSLAAARSKKLAAFVNRAMPDIDGEPGPQLDDLALAIDVDTPLPEYPAGAPSPQIEAIALHAVTLINDGDTIQIGIGKVQSAIVRALHAHQDIGVHSGMVDEAIVELADKGVITGRRKDFDKEIILTGMVFGTRATYEFCALPGVKLRAADYTHAPKVLGEITNFVAINSAVEIDLFGQTNAELVYGGLVSGSGGFHDFMIGARLSANGRSIVALPATGGSVSRIVATLCEPGIVTGLRSDADIFVTEHGIAKVRDLAQDARAEALIQIAAPEHRGTLADQWRDMRKHL
ncbi:MAG TPA: acetyl-CoA hydrolase/transferase C-terminal domain-containing protein [Beijerinckiaceae bacterium]|jgi:acyl-CoA hydrolase|nr:acetyl-CoA hydrolase/transferase C-terminal domain-containing protein [Beijerinckiaceae bacterium]